MNTRPYRPYGGRKSRRWLWILAGLALAAILLFTGLTAYIALNGRTDLAGQPDVMVIFGCQMKKDGPSVLLRDRLDTALDYLDAHPGLTVIVSGGQGDDEHVSEAQGMYDYLTAHGVDGAQIWMEDQSHNTWQNVNYTLDLMAERGLPSEGDVLLVSSGFHLSRIRLLWDRAQDARNASGEAAPAYGVSTLAAPVSHFPSRIQMFFREPLALVKSFVADR